MSSPFAYEVKIEIDPPVPADPDLAELLKPRQVLVNGESIGSLAYNPATEDIEFQPAKPRAPHDADIEPMGGA